MLDSTLDKECKEPKDAEQGGLGLEDIARKEESNEMEEDLQDACRKPQSYKWRMRLKMNRAKKGGEC